MMRPTWYNDIDLWFKKYDFDDEVMLALFNHCFDKSTIYQTLVKVIVH